jgi:hypothetical protein
VNDLAAARRKWQAKASIVVSSRPMAIEDGAAFDVHDDKIVNIKPGAIAQLGERIVRNDEVVGSIPTSSTILTH